MMGKIYGNWLPRDTQVEKSQEPPLHVNYWGRRGEKERKKWPVKLQRKKYTRRKHGEDNGEGRDRNGCLTGGGGK
jgi:hypothetical protein